MPDFALRIRGVPGGRGLAREQLRTDVSRAASDLIV